MGGMMVPMPRSSLVSEIARTVTALHPERVVRVGIDGVDGAGKTVFADELAEAVAHSGRATIRAGVDGFHHPRRVRHRRGRDSPEGYFHDAYDYAVMRQSVLDPLSPGGDRRYRTAAFDHWTDQPVDSEWRHASADAVLIVDGIFLHRPELREFWDFSIFLDVTFEVSIPRGAQRGYGDPDPSAASNRRYVEGQLLYLDRCRPAERASVVIDHNVLDAPVVVRHHHSS